MTMDKYDVERHGSQVEREAYAEIEQLVAEAGANLIKARDLAREHDLSFTLDLPDYMEPGRELNDRAWNHSGCTIGY